MITTVLFDIDDTLVDFRGAMMRGLRLHLADVAGHLSATELTHAQRVWRELEVVHFGRYLRGKLTFAEQRRARAAALCEMFGLPLGSSVAAQDEWVAAYLRHCDASFRLFPDVLPALDLLAERGFRLGALSNSDHDYQEAKLRGLGVRERFAALVCCDDVDGLAKPDPRMFLACCAAMGAAPEECVYVGDREDTDAAAATAAGLRGVWLDRSGGGVDSVCDLNQFAELVTSLTATTMAGGRA